MDTRQALWSLGEITGEITTEDLLENIFSKFCIWKRSKVLILPKAKSFYIEYQQYQKHV